MGESNKGRKDSFLVCGLGSLGQYCVSVLKEFEVTVNAIEASQAPIWEIPDLNDLMDCLLIGDCRQPKLLEQAGIRDCRAILLVTSDERVNIAAAFAARSLNPNIRLVVRSAQENLNELLGQQLGNFIAFEATQLPAPSFALAALDSETQGLFTLEKQRLRISTTHIQPDHRWCDRRLLYELNTPNRRVLRHFRATVMPPANSFYQWDPDTRVQAGDTITYIEATEAISPPHLQTNNRRRVFWQELALALEWQNVRRTLQQFWRESTQTQRVALLSSVVMLSLFISGALLYKLQYPDISLQDALNVSLVLAIGGFDNLFGQLKVPFAIPWWLHLFSVGMTVAGTIFIGILYATLTERVLASRFQFLKRRPPVPKAEHVVLVGLGRLGQRIATLLQELKQPLVGVHAIAIDPGVLPQMAIVTGNLHDTLARVNLATAKSMIIVTDDEVANLEIALMAQAANPNCNLVVRVFDPAFTQHVAQLLPAARVMGAYALAAAAFAGAAFGENILNLFRLNDRTTLVTEYQIEPTDTLNGRLLADIAYGYGVVPILHQKGAHEPARLMPSDDIRLQVGDRLVVLATLSGLQRVERGISKAPRWQVQVERAISEEAIFEGAGAIARLSGCSIGTAREVMSHLPDTVPTLLHKHQAQRLVRELNKLQVLASLVRAS
ncbi:potassium channel family protein [Stenomitos frigidus]|uniref:Potassium transporter TrkA n=1 Tax=Stenomitos frigidus ULC18 TaxID=2107698 RepID=A0A2T1E6D1_9CYAN|nr:NAD-binding protein [Stenomitos frigidus]PSB28307.1 potassium transporter TrkA [Stenomitos frigidus ULC18]